MQGYGCHKCGLIKQKTVKRLPLEEFIRRSRLIHGDKYDYSKVNYINKSTEVEIICPIHGSFWQKPVFHYHNSGCQKCNESTLEREIRVLLEENDIKYEYEYRFDWLSKMSLDFYLPEYNIAIECQGRQHFEPNEFLDSDEKVKERDKIKKKLCDENGIKLLYYSNLGIEYPYQVFEDKEELLKEIINAQK